VRIALAAVLLVSALGLGVQPPPRGAASADALRAGFLQAAELGVRQARVHWWDSRRGWYDERLDKTWQPNRPLARLWSVYPLFESLDAIALGDPTPAHRAAVRVFAANAEEYYNARVAPVGGYAYYIDTRISTADTFFDDNGWWGIAFVDAYRATGDRRYLADAEKALRFISVSGWDPAAGGTWWDTRHRHKTAEPLAAGAYVAVALYEATGETSYLRTALKFVDWADTHAWNADSGLYARSDTDATVLDYVQGMMIGAHLELCELPGRRADCVKAEALARASAIAFRSDWEPASDVIYLRFVLDLYRHDGNPRWYRLVEKVARRAAVNGRAPGGLFLNRWDGTTARGTLLRFHAATVSLFAWLGATAPPG
jgi:Glycosyl hydrolase family 76